MSVLRTPDRPGSRGAPRAAIDRADLDHDRPPGPIIGATGGGAESLQALNNLAVVRMWWTVLESEWRQAFLEREGDDAADTAIVDPRLRAAVGQFEELDAVLDDLMAWGDRVVVSFSLRGRIENREVSSREAWVCRLEEATVTEVLHYPTVQEALASYAPARGPQGAIGPAYANLGRTPV